jgi:hypothetical protein
MSLLDSVICIYLPTYDSFLAVNETSVITQFPDTVETVSSGNTFYGRMYVL